MVTYFKTLEFGSIAASGSAEKEWTPDTNIVIKKVVANERSNAALNNVQAYIAIADVPYTKTMVPLSILGTNIEYCWKPNLSVSKGAKIYVKLTNSGTSAVTVDLIFEYEKG